MSLLEQLPSDNRSVWRLDLPTSVAPPWPRGSATLLRKRFTRTCRGPSSLATDRPTLEQLLTAVASGDREPLVALEDRIAGLVRVNIRRVIRDASRCDEVTQEFFTDVAQDATNFDPDRDSAESWLLTRAHLQAVVGLTRDTPEFVNETTSPDRSPNPVDDLDELVGGHRIQVTAAGSLDVSGAPTPLLDL